MKEKSLLNSSKIEIEQKGRGRREKTNDKLQCNSHEKSKNGRENDDGRDKIKK